MRAFYAKSKQGKTRAYFYSKKELNFETPTYNSCILEKCTSKKSF